MLLKTAKREKVVGLSLKMTKRSTVDIGIPLKLGRRIEDLLRRSDLTSGVFQCVLDDYDRSANDSPRSSGVERISGCDDQFRLNLVLPDNDWYRCTLKVPLRLASKKTYQSLLEAIAGVNTRGWFGKDEEKSTQTNQPEEPREVPADTNASTRTEAPTAPPPEPEVDKSLVPVSTPDPVLRDIDSLTLEFLTHQQELADRLEKIKGEIRAANGHLADLGRLRQSQEEFLERARRTNLILSSAA